MRKSSLAMLAAAAFAPFASQIAIAADLGRPPPPAPIYIPPAPVPYLWTGCYVGGNVAGAWSNAEVSDVATGGTASASNSGVAGGGQIGCDYQAGAWVVGVRNMFDGTSLSGSGTLSTTPFTGTANSRTNWFDALTARGGYLLQPNLLLYVQGGAAWTNTNVTFFDSTGAQVGQFSNDRTGWTTGAGAEWMFAPHWSVFGEYNFMGFGTQSAAFTACNGSCVRSTRANIQDAMVGLNYKF
ncbi:MAG: outer membrane beta-barrel protein [Xanthobacteraceae bacterium]